MRSHPDTVVIRSLRKVIATAIAIGLCGDRLRADQLCRNVAEFIRVNRDAYENSVKEFYDVDKFED